MASEDVDRPTRQTAQERGVERNVAIEVAGKAPGEAKEELQEKLDALTDSVADRGGVPLRSSDGSRYGARFSVTAPDPASAVDKGMAVFKEAAAAAGVPDSPVVEVEAKTLDELADEHQFPEVPDLIDVHGLAEMLGVGHRLATILIRVKGFPSPVAELAGGPVWARVSVERFLRTNPIESVDDLPERTEAVLDAEEPSGSPEEDSA